MSEQMRKEFEAWCTDSTEKSSDGLYYKQPFTRAYWKAWQAALATQPQAPQGGVPESAILQRAKYHAYEADDCGPADYQIFEPGPGECADCIEVLIVRADAVNLAPTETPEAGK
jgi:hypothetical protein